MCYSEPAVVKLGITFEKFAFTDYLSMLQIDGKWIIVGKIYHYGRLRIRILFFTRPMVYNFVMGDNSRKRKTQDPCQECFLHKERCICSEIPHLTLKTKVSLIIHAKELKRTTNTGRLALKALTNSEMRVRGLDHSPLDLSDLVSAEYRSLLFYPSDDAVELNEVLLKESSLPIHLIVPDGNWRQASKVHYRHHELAGVQRVKISSPNTAPFHIRAENTEAGMATLEAIAHAMGIIEGAAIREKLLKFYQRKLEETLSGRGQKIDIKPQT